MKYLKLFLAAIVLMSGCAKHEEAPSPQTAQPEPTAQTDGDIYQIMPDMTADPAAGSEPVTITNAVDLEVLYDHPDMSGYQWLTDPEPAFVEISLKESIRMFSEGGSGILYYGRTGCHWCQRAVPVLNQIAKEKGVTVYYVNVGSPISDDPAQGRLIYDTLCSYIDVIFEVENGERIFQIPEVISVKNGEIMGHKLSLTDGFEIVDENSQMNEEQTEELRNIYRLLMNLAAD
ncbi:MAG: thioredoxin family protein [Solobacterium sp.]|nr:thioredoxin family protein [Solobacterium sp.]